jgi:endonuclease YncB( thermonuclease family)
MNGLGTACALVVASCVVACSAAENDVLVGKVLKIVDGDTADVLLDSGKIRVRLHGIDAPETDQPYVDDATALLSRLIAGQEVELEVVEQDRYDRMVSRVHVGGKDANAEMIKRGLRRASLPPAG